MKIGFVIDDSLDKTDGVQQYVLTLGNWLTQNGHEVHYLTGETQRRDIKNMYSLSKNVRVRFNHNRLSIPLPAKRRNIERIVLGEDFDILHVQIPYSPMLAAKIVSIAPDTTKIIGTFHILPFSKGHARANKVLGLILKRNLTKFAAIMSVSPAAQTFAKEAYGIDSIVVPNAVDVQAFRIARPIQLESIKHIVFLGRLVERKGCEYLLRAIKNMVDNGETGFVVDICGRGEQELALKQFTKDNGLDNYVKFHGFLSEEDKPRYLAGADIAVFPSLGGESFGIVLIEAMAAGSKVVLGGNNPGYTSVLRPQQLFNPRSIRAFTAILTHYLHDQEAIRSAMVWQRHAVKQYDVTMVANKVLAVYNEALHRNKT